MKVTRMPFNSQRGGGVGHSTALLIRAISRHTFVSWIPNP